MSGAGGPAPLDTFDPVRLRQAFEPGGTLSDSGFISLFNNSMSYLGLQSQISYLRGHVTTATGDDLQQSMTRLAELERIQRMLGELASFNIRRPDFDRARRDCAAKLLAGASNPPRTQDYQEGVRTFTGLRSYQGLEAERGRMRSTLESLTPGRRDGAYMFLLDTSDLSSSELDPTRDPSRQTLEDRTVVRVYRMLRDSSDPNDQRLARAAERLYGHFQDQNRAYDEGFLPDVTASSGMIEQANQDLDGLLHDPDVAAFLKKVGEAERMRLGADEGGQLSLDVSDSFSAYAAYPSVIPILERFDQLVMSRQTPEHGRDILRRTADDMARSGDRYAAFLRRTGRNAEADDAEMNAQELRNLSGYLSGLSGPELNRTNLAASAGQVARIARAFQPLEESFLRDALTRKLDQIEKLPSEENNIQPIRDALAAITATTPADPAARLAAFRNVAGQIDQAAIIRLVDARIQTLRGPMLETARTRDVLVEALGVMAGAPIASANAYRSLEAAERQKYNDLADAYARLRPRLLAGDPAARRELQAMEGSSMLKDLQVGAENAATFNQAFVISSMVLATAGIVLLTPYIAAGSAVAVSFLPVSLGTAEVLTTVLTYAVTGGLMTAANRMVTGIVMPQAEQGSFLVEWAVNTAMMGVGSGAMRLGKAAFNVGLEWMAARNIAARTGTALAAPGLATGAELTALEMEKQTIMRGLLAQFGQQATMFGVEYAAIQAFEFVRMVGILSARGVADPVAKTLAHMANFRTQALMGGFMLVMKAQGLTQTPQDNPALVDLTLRARYRTLARSFNSELPRFQADFEAAGIQEPRDLLAHPELLGRARDMLTYRREMLAIEARANPNDVAVARDLQTTSQQLGVIDPLSRYMTGVETVFGDGNRFGVQAAEWDTSGNAYVYQPGRQGKIVATLRDLPWVDSANVRVNPNGVIEIPFLASPFNPEPQMIRLVPATAARPATRPVTATPAH